jgi:hypothetical protein
MKLTFVINYRLDSPLSSQRHAELLVPNAKSEDYENKDKYLLFFCQEVANFCQGCSFYKDVQVMAPFLERPIRIKYMIALPSNTCILLDASLKYTELRKKASELKNYFEIANEQNRSNLNVKYAVLLIPPHIVSCIDELEKEYTIKIMTLKKAINFIKEMMTDAKSN